MALKFPGNKKPADNNAQYFADKRGQADMTKVDARRWFDNNGTYTRSAVMEMSF